MYVYRCLLTCQSQRLQQHRFRSTQSSIINPLLKGKNNETITKTKRLDTWAARADSASTPNGVKSVYFELDIDVQPHKLTKNTKTRKRTIGDEGTLVGELSGMPPNRALTSAVASAIVVEPRKIEHNKLERIFWVVCTGEQSVAQCEGCARSTNRLPTYDTHARSKRFDTKMNLSMYEC